MLNPFKRIKKALFDEPIFSTTHEYSARTINLPINGLSPLVAHYGEKGGGDFPVLLVAIYNTDQLASEIAKYLKNDADDSSEGNNDSKTAPEST